MSHQQQHPQQQQLLHPQPQLSAASQSPILPSTLRVNNSNYTNGTLSLQKLTLDSSHQQQQHQQPGHPQLPQLQQQPQPQQLQQPQPQQLQQPQPQQPQQLQQLQQPQQQRTSQSQVLSVRVPKYYKQHNTTNASAIVIDLESQRIAAARSTTTQLHSNRVCGEPHLAYHSHYYYNSANHPVPNHSTPQAHPTPNYSTPIYPSPTYPAPTYPAPTSYPLYTNNYPAQYIQHPYTTYQNGYNNGQNNYNQAIQPYYHISQHQLQQTKPMSVQPTTKPGPKLIWLLFMHRHGDRAPLNMAPRDKYNNITYWPEGFGNLNNAGRLRMFKLGKFVRNRYDDFLTDNIREVYSRSSDVDRCIESSHAFLAGLYPPSNRFEWNVELLWIPAPVHTVPAPEDYLLNEAGRKFLIEFINEIHLVQNSDAVKKLYEESVKERELLERELGYEYDMFYKFKCTYSTLDIEERNGLTMPAWYTPELKQKLYRFAGIAFGLAGGGTEKLKKIRCGHLLDDIVSRMEMASIDGPRLRDQSDFQQPTNAPTDVDERKIIHYSTHDSIMAAFLESLNINTPTPVPPGFGATFFIELYVDLNEKGLPVSEKYIKLFYMDDTDSEKPVEKRLPNCRLNEKGQLTLNNFKKYIGHLLPSNSNCNL